MKQDKAYLEVILSALRACKNYKPKFGHSSKIDGFSLRDFQQLYGQDIFYKWFGLDSPLMYSAHKAAGGITSVYRQIGTGCERLFNKIVRDKLSLTVEQASWEYTIPGGTTGTRKLRLDARIKTDDLKGENLERFTVWLEKAKQKVRVPPDTGLKGAVFEVRQGYKSKDSKRQNADIANAANAYAEGYLPVVVLLSSQIDDDVYTRYAAARWLILKGLPNSKNPYESTFAFSKEVLDYDLARFFKANSKIIKHEIDSILRGLLSAN